MPGPRLRPTHRVHGDRFLDSFAELCRHTQLEGLYSGRWYRVAVAGVDEGGARLLYLDTDETEVLRPADFERGSWRARGGSRGGAPLPEVALQGSEAEDREEDDTAEEGSAEEGRLLGSLLEVAGSLLARA